MLSVEWSLDCMRVHEEGVLSRQWEKEDLKVIRTYYPRAAGEKKRSIPYASLKTEGSWVVLHRE